MLTAAGLKLVFQHDSLKQERIEHAAALDDFTKAINEDIQSVLGDIQKWELISTSPWKDDLGLKGSNLNRKDRIIENIATLRLQPDSFDDQFLQYVEKPGNGVNKYVAGAFVDAVQCGGAPNDKCWVVKREQSESTIDSDKGTLYHMVADATQTYAKNVTGNKYYSGSSIPFTVDATFVTVYGDNTACHHPFLCERNKDCKGMDTTVASVEAEVNRARDKLAQAKEGSKVQNLAKASLAKFEAMLEMYHEYYDLPKFKKELGNAKDRVKKAKAAVKNPKTKKNVAELAEAESELAKANEEYKLASSIKSTKSPTHCCIRPSHLVMESASFNMLCTALNQMEGKKFTVTVESGKELLKPLRRDAI